MRPLSKRPTPTRWAPRGVGQKASDFSAVPLCSGHHREYSDSYHRLGEQEFSYKHGIDLKELALRLQRQFWQAGRRVRRLRLFIPMSVGEVGLEQRLRGCGSEQQGSGCFGDQDSREEMMSAVQESLQLQPFSPADLPDDGREGV